MDFLRDQYERDVVYYMRSGLKAWGILGMHTDWDARVSRVSADDSFFVESV